MEELLKRFDYLIDIAGKFRNIKKSHIAKKFGYSRLTQKAKEEILKKYEWGAILYLEDLIGFSYETLEKLNTSSSLRASKYMTDVDVHAVNVILTINNTFHRYIGEKVNLPALKKFLGNSVQDTKVKNFRELVSKLAQFNLFVVQGTLENVSGFSIDNFILINQYEKEERKLWTLIHELFHIVKQEYGFRKLRNQKERDHENEVADYIFRGVNLPQKQVTLKEVRKIKESLPLDISLNALIKFYKQRGLYIDKFDPSKRQNARGNKRIDLKEKIVSIKFPYEYLEFLEDKRLENSQLLELFGINPSLWEGIDAPLHEYLKTNYCY